MAVDLEGLSLFLVEAKKSTYAAQKGKVASSRKGAKDLGYQSKGYSYLDSYFGEKDFSGQEVVYLDEVPIWSMNYYGRLTDDLAPGFIELLREALMGVGAPSPYRGCSHLQRGNYQYYCQSEGSVTAFTGQERIEYMNVKVYTLQFHGGQIR